jgi:hypothetical protein
MGFDAATIHVLLTAREDGVSFNRVLTIGRQWLYVTKTETRALLARHGILVSARQVSDVFTEQKGYCEPLLKLLGAGRIDSIDASTYEGASILHDMNWALPEVYRHQFSVVIDGGSLEHVFDYPRAIKNCMEAVAIGGHFIGITPANNLMGHGFYQFSPELFYRVFTPANGFRIASVTIYECPWKGVWYEVANPKQVQRRVELTNRRPAYLIVRAEKTASVPIFQEPPQQSDYAAIWERSTAHGIGNGSSNEKSEGGEILKRYAPAWMARMYRTIRPFRAKLYTRKRLG